MCYGPYRPHKRLTSRSSGYMTVKGRVFEEARKQLQSHYACNKKMGFRV